MTSRNIVFQFTGFHGWEVIYNFLPQRTQTRRVARAMLRSYPTWRPGHDCTLVVRMPWGDFAITDVDGSVEPATGAARLAVL